LSPRYFAFWNKWEPGAISSQHGHTGDTAAYDALLEARGARSVPLPMPKHLPPWILAKLGGGFTSSVTQWSTSD
jgi:hypothetical protein